MPFFKPLDYGQFYNIAIAKVYILKVSNFAKTIFIPKHTSISGVCFKYYFNLPVCHVVSFFAKIQK